MLKYGSDKPDLRNPLVIADVGEVFAGSDFKVFAGIVAGGGVVRAIPAPKTADRPRSFFDKMNAWAQSEGAPGLGYIVFEGDTAKGPIAKFLNDERLAKLKALAGVGAGDAVFFVADKKPLAAAKLAGAARKKLGEELELIQEERVRFCWIVDFPMYELNEDTGKIEFSHNPFSMPQGELEALTTKDPLDDQGLPV
jgi:aspartyl-tRNA synthetase